MAVTEMQRKDVFAVMTTRLFVPDTNVVIMPYVVCLKMEYQSVIALRIIPMAILALNVSIRVFLFFFLQILIYFFGHTKN